ncbi:MAG: 30S ribosomal protein S15 [Alphaproteobacteria bacterium]|nr:30S ribosomal protein S15 [Alphaproteobacteria bacterium]
MSITKEKRQELVKKHQSSKNDTGSVEVQVSIITERINSLTGHMKIHKKDFHSRRGLLILVSRRRSLLDYLKKKSEDRYNNLVKALGLRK